MADDLCPWECRFHTPPKRDPRHAAGASGVFQFMSGQQAVRPKALQAEGIIGTWLSEQLMPDKGKVLGPVLKPVYAGG